MRGAATLARLTLGARALGARALGAAALAAALAGCAGPQVALLDGEGGAPAGAVAVLDPATGAERGQLAEANTEARLRGGGGVRARPLKADYGALLAAMPAPPQVFTLYFVEGTTELAPDSLPTLEALRRAIGPTSEVQITGHTDTTGDPASNDRLSLDRAVEVRSALVADGLPVGSAKVTGRGQRELKVKTGPGVSEPANRRVEVIVR
ncbi:MAG: OmpA family protein [Caulobacteraceae bacterium]|nr:OmpA family protein [Caulobacteraceae bacterium]